MTDYDRFRVGAVRQPLPTDSPNSLLRDADPALFFFLDFMQYVIRTYPGPRLLQALSTANVTAPGGSAIEDACAQAYPYEPLPEYLENQVKFPSLFAYRKELSTEWQTVGHENDVDTLEVYYVLPPLDAAGAEQVLPILNAVRQALRRKVTDAWDPGYTPPGGAKGDQFDAAPYANVNEIGFGEYGGKSKAVARMGSMGFLPGMGAIYFPCLMLRAFVAERDNYDPTGSGTGPGGGPSKLAGVDVTLNVQAADGTVLPASSTTVAQASTQGPPVIVSLGLATGTSLGGDSVTLTGALFLAGPPLVFFGPASSPTYAPSVTYNSPTSLTVTTPAMQGAGVVDVTVVNRDQQSGTLAKSFTFT